jgi:predicted ABC-type ATPase
MAVSTLWIVAGPNGAGKTTCVQKEPISTLIPELRFTNPDDRTLEKLRAHGFQGFADAPVDLQTRLFFESADEVYAELEMAISQSIGVGVETVLSSRKYCRLVEAIQHGNGFFGLIYICLSSPVLAKVRVAARVLRGGHGIPDDKIELRWHRSLENLAWFARRATVFWVVDNSDSDPAIPPLLVAAGKHGILEQMDAGVFSEMRNALSTLPQKSPQI